MDNLIRKFNKNRPFIVFDFLKNKPQFYVDSSIHRRINLKSRLESFYLNSLVYRFKQPY